MRKLEAFIITVAVYALLFFLYMLEFRHIKVVPVSQSETVIKIDIKEMPKPTAVPPKPLPKKKVIQKTPAPKKEIAPKPIPQPKVVQTKKTTPPPKHTPKQVVTPKKVEISKKAPHKVPVEKRPKEVQPSEMLYIPNPILQQNPTQENKNLASILGTSPSTPAQPSVPKTPKIAKLYGKKFDAFTPTQQKFIVRNLDEIQRITQNTLTRRGYPAGALAARTGQEGVNIVSFDLHPNGDISNLRLLKPIGYRALDENTIETIKSAYKDYPYPTETTKIIFYVEYLIFGY